MLKGASASGPTGHQTFQVSCPEPDVTTVSRDLAQPPAAGDSGDIQGSGGVMGGAPHR